MKILYTLLFVVSVACTKSFAQGYEVSAKLYTNAYLFNTDIFPTPFNLKDGFFRFKGFTPAIHLYSEEKWTYHELEFSNLSYKTHKGQLEDVREFLVGLRYEYGKVIDVDLGKDFQFLLGGSARLFYYNRLNTPNISNRFEQTYKETKAVLGLVPRIKYRIDERFSLDLNAIISTLAVGLETSYSDNPLLSRQSRTQSNFNTEFFFLGDWTFRLGVAYRLGD